MITVYSKPATCYYCIQTAKWLTAHGFEFHEVDVTADPKALEFIKSRGHQTVPQIYLGETLLVEGGYTGMIKLGATALHERLAK